MWKLHLRDEQLGFRYKLNWNKIYLVNLVRGHFFCRHGRELFRQDDSAQNVFAQLAILIALQVENSGADLQQFETFFTGFFYKFFASEMGPIEIETVLR